jgi:hypothetical protein
MRSKILSFGGRRVAGAAGLVAVLALIAYVVVAVPGQAAPSQPVPFPHIQMVQAGVPCLFCHSDATRSPSAGIPSVEKCMGCHQVIAKDRPAIQQIAGYFQRGEPISWERVNKLPRHVHFTHQVHVASGLNCERCHGDVGRMVITRQPVFMDMGWCLDCHTKQPNAAQLQDCVICHF